MCCGQQFSERNADSQTTKVIGILGGLGPRAHMEFERLLLAASGQSQLEQGFPPWVTVSFPSTPDRTKAIVEGGESPLPMLIRGMKILDRHADFAVMACITVHHYLDAIRGALSIPIIDIVEETIRQIGDGQSTGPIGLLATTGTLRSGLFQKTTERINSNLHFISLLDLPGGGQIQEDLVMAPIFGKLTGDGSRSGGFKTDIAQGGATRKCYEDPMWMAIEQLRRAGANTIIAACTEIPMMLGSERTDTMQVMNPLEIAANVAIEIANGTRSV